ncbi:MAG: ATP-binding protein [Candidatus Saccharimonadia bacterium]
MSICPDERKTRKSERTLKGNYITIPQVVLTGGPCSGKSLVHSALQSYFGDQVTFVAEAATSLLSGGFPLPGRDLDWSADWQAHFQRAVAGLQCALEMTAQVRARQAGHKIIILDRGLLDGGAYLPRGLHELVELTGQTIDQMLRRYTLVVQLETLAASKPELFGQDNNLQRFETEPEKAVLIDRNLEMCWRWPNNSLIWRHIPVTETFQEKIWRVKSLIDSILSEQTK